MEKGNSLDEIVKIDFLGDEFKFKPDSQVENPEQIAQNLEKYIKEVEGLFKNKGSRKNEVVILLLAAMNLSKDFHELKLQHSELEKEIDKRISSLTEKVDKGFKNNNDQ